MENKIVKREIIPSLITLSWSKDGKTFNCINKYSVSCYQPLVDDEFTEVFIDDSKSDNQFSDEIFVPEVLSTLDDIISGGSVENEESRRNLALILSSQYFLNRFSIGAKTIFVLNNIDEISKFDATDDLMDFATEEVMRTRKLSDRFQAEYMAIKASSFFWDLKCVRLQAPPSTPFILGNRPFITLNLLNESDADEYIYAICCYGALLIMPISPFSALCFYDESVYKVRSREGKLILSDDDVCSINLYTIGETETFAFLTTQDKDKNYYLNLARDKERLENIKANIDLPQFRVLASRAEIEARTMRPFTSALMSYDTKHEFEEDYIQKRVEFINDYLGIRASE